VHELDREPSGLMIAVKDSASGIGDSGTIDQIEMISAHEHPDPMDQRLQAKNKSIRGSLSGEFDMSWTRTSESRRTRFSGDCSKKCRPLYPGLMTLGSPVL
jgi:hypothetical protein